MIIRTLTSLIIISLLFPACNHNDPKGNDERQTIPVEYSFPPIVTDMLPSSPIALPEELSCESGIIVSKEMMEILIPLEYIDKDSKYNSIDFSKKSLFYVKFRSFYEISSIEYSVWTTNDNIVTIAQRINTSGQFLPYGQYIMSNILIEKLDIMPNINLQQSVFFEE